MWLAMMNSNRARPTPSQGMAARWKASSGLPTFIRMRVRVGGRSVIDCSSRWNGRAPGYTCPSSPSQQLRVTVSPSWRRRLPSTLPTIAVMPISRAMIAAWQVRPPWSVTTPRARFRIGSQSGSVRSVTSRSPASNRSISPGWRSTRTTPLLTEAPIARPLTTGVTW